ncbi:hypothetical protein VTK26DRAFT_702 [Humicola hyalothermophila]
MLSNDPGALPSAQLALQLHPPSQTVPAHAIHASSPDNGYVSPRQHLGSRTSTPGSPLQPTPKLPQQEQHDLNAPHPSLSPLSEYHSGFGVSDDDLGSPSPSPSPYNLANHRRQYSVPNLLPLAFKSRTPSPTRKTHAKSPSEQMPYTGDGRSNGRSAANSPRGIGGGFVGWLSSASGAASALGLSHPEARSSPGANANGSSNHATTLDTTPTRPRRSTNGSGLNAGSTAPKNSMTAASRFMSAISSRFNPTGNTGANLAAAADDDDDELCNLNIEAALFPHHASSSSSSSSPTSPRDPFSPAAFKNLHMNAVGLLTKMQAAYRERTAALRELQAERSAQRDELEEAETRARHLKMQLEDMARKAQEHERAMRELMEELAAERRARAEESRRMAAGEKNDGGSGGGGAGIGGALPSPPSEGASIVSEDLGVDEDRRRRRHRRRRGSRDTTDDGDEEDETESVESESVFSSLPDGSDGAVTPQHSTSTAPQPQKSLSQGGSVQATGSTPKRRPAGGGQQPMSAFQKIFKGISGGDDSSSGSNGCRNCKGQGASVAWDTVGVLRDENRHLKRRVGELEVAVEGALDLVKGIGL